MNANWARLFFVSMGVAGLGAHPLGNFSVSHYTRITPGAKGVEVVYVLDLAEIPAFEMLRDWKVEATASQAELTAKAHEQARGWMRGLDFRAGGRVVTPRFDGADVVLSDGAANLKVMRITSRLHLPGVTGGELTFEDHNFEGRAGWKEIVIAPAIGAVVETASQTDQDRSNGLTSYPADVSAPPQDLRASLKWTVAAAPAVEAVAVAPKAPVIARIEQPKAPSNPAVPPASAGAPGAVQPAGTVVKGDFLSRLMSNKDLSLWMIVSGLAVAFAIGAVHAFTPGHGKTMVAAYLVGSRGSAKHAILLGAMVTFTHTISVFLLGIVTLFLAQYVVPETLIKGLELISGLSILLIGATLFVKRFRVMRAYSAKRRGHRHSHNSQPDHVHEHAAVLAGAGAVHVHDHGHSHDHGHTHGPDGHTHHIEGDVSMGSLLALGASGGLVPCPSALVLMLSSIAVGRIAFGLTLLVAFSLGLAIVLTSIGVMVVYAKHLLPDSNKTSRHPLFRLVPVLSAAVIVCIGLVMTLVALGLINPKLAI